MIDEELSPFLPRYCMFCGAPLVYTEISTVPGEGRASYKCTGCGNQNTENWSEMSFTRADQSDESFSDEQLTSQFSDDLWMPPLPPPPPLPPYDPAMSPPPFDFSIVEKNRNAEEEFREHQKQVEALGRQINADGPVAIVRAAHFPLLALVDLQERFPFQTFGYGSGCSQGETPRPLSSFSLSYSGPNSTERINIEQEDIEKQLGLHRLTDELETYDAELIVRFLAGLTGSEGPEMQKLWEGMAIYQYVNINTVRSSSVVSAHIQLQIGELVSWKIRRFHAPLPIAHAQAQIENTIVEVGAIGAAADEIEKLLKHMTRLTPESVALEQLNAGFKKLQEHFEHYYLFPR